MADADTRTRSPALELVRAFVNTLDVEGGTDEFAAPAGARGWLAAQGILASGSSVSEAQRRKIVEVREALRALLLVNNGAPADPAAIAALNRAARSAPLALEVSESSGNLVPAVSGTDGAVAAILAAVSTSMADGTWTRLKACRDDACRWAFYDRSRNRSGHWCSMAVCGNRAKARNYRERHRE